MNIGGRERDRGKKERGTENEGQIYQSMQAGVLRSSCTQKINVLLVSSSMAARFCTLHLRIYLLSKSIFSVCKYFHNCYIADILILLERLQITIIIIIFTKTETGKV